MALQTKGDLKASILSFLARDDTDPIPVDDLVTMAESEFNRFLRTQRQFTTSQFDITGNDGTVALPDDVLNIKEVKVVSANPIRTLTQTSAEVIDSYYCTTRVGIPQFYVIEGSNLRLAPLPNADMTGSLSYFAAIQALTDDSSANWLLTAWPDLYLYTALGHAELFLGGDATEQRIATFQAKKQEIYQAIDIAERRHNVTSGPVSLAFRRLPTWGRRW